jgi:hypothetical protein
LRFEQLPLEHFDLALFLSEAVLGHSGGYRRGNCYGRY